MEQYLVQQLENLKEASYTLQSSSFEQRNHALKLIKQALLKNQSEIIAANKKDLEKMGEDDPLYDRLLLSEDRIAGICQEIDTVINLDDPLGRKLEEYDVPSGLHLKKVSVPLGVIGVIYEARPNVTVDVTSLCLKSGNCVLLRGSSNAYESNKALVKIIQQALEDSEIPTNSIALLEPDRKLAQQMMKADQYLDLIIPRGSASLIQTVRAESSVPTIETGASVVHTFVDESADIHMACDIIFNEKTRRPSVCNSLDTVLVHQNIAEAFLPELTKTFLESGTVFNCDEKSYQIIKDLYPAEQTTANANQYFDKEFLSLEMNVAFVESLDEAIEHIRKYSLKHSESIVTSDEVNAQKFLQEVDAACVYVNTSTAFSDGAQFGLGAEIGISTQKLHARGPMGLKELTSYKWLVTSDGKVRN